MHHDSRENCFEVLIQTAVAVESSFQFSLVVGW